MRNWNSRFNEVSEVWGTTTGLDCFGQQTVRQPGIYQQSRQIKETLSLRHKGAGWGQQQQQQQERIEQSNLKNSQPLSAESSKSESRVEHNHAQVETKKRRETLLTEKGDDVFGSICVLDTHAIGSMQKLTRGHKRSFNWLNLSDPKYVVWLDSFCNYAHKMYLV